MITTQHVTVVTGTARSGGTDAHVYLTMFGSNGNSGERELDNHANNFEVGANDVFSIEMEDIGEIERVRVRHDNSGEGPGWFLDRVIIHNERTDSEVVFPCNRWLAIDEDDGQINRLLDRR